MVSLTANLVAVLGALVMVIMSSLSSVNERKNMDLDLNFKPKQASIGVLFQPPSFIFLPLGAVL